MKHVDENLLLKLVQVYEHTCQPFKDKFTVTSQLGLAADIVNDGHSHFVDNAIAPLRNWRSARPEELRYLRGDANDHALSRIVIITLSRIADTLAKFLGDRRDLVEVQRKVRDVRFYHVLEDCVDDLAPYCMDPKEIICQGACANAGGLHLVTHDMHMRPMKRIGLHVDDWDRRIACERGYGRRRLCLNLGLSSRHLIFLLCPFSYLVALGKIKIDTENRTPASYVRGYLSSNRSQLAVRLRLDPGEAYIMNADDVIHDAASDIATTPDIALHFLGYFGAAGSLEL